MIKKFLLSAFVLCCFNSAIFSQSDSLGVDSNVFANAALDISDDKYFDGFDLIARYDSISQLDFLFDEVEFSSEEGEEQFAISDSIIQLQMNLLNEQSPMDFRITKDVSRFITLYAKKKKNLTEKTMGLADLYFPLFEEMLDRYDIPMEMKYLPIVESGMNPKARSRVGATGLWQFMYYTGKKYGLDVNSYIDERRDPYLATEAPCQYLPSMS